MAITEQRLDETAMANGTAMMLADDTQPDTWIKQQTPEQIAVWLALDLSATGLLSWDVFQGVLSSVELILLTLWRDAAAAKAHQANQTSPAPRRLRAVRVIRDYGKYQRIEAPQYYRQAEPC
jgi:quinol monooxygenase YgiN